MGLLRFYCIIYITLQRITPLMNLSTNINHFTDYSQKASGMHSKTIVYITKILRQPTIIKLSNLMNKLHSLF